MEIVRKIINADVLRPVIDLPWISGDLKVEVIVIPQIKETTQKREVSIENLTGCLKEYANPALWDREQHAWEDNIVEKYGHI
ncbi:MAG: hypothetical protein LBE91_15570 [Tannerella sp.]|jgi:hypothetical protein|nr:hypothetical protein [Tannerella sp.]